MVLRRSRRVVSRIASRKISALFKKGARRRIARRKIARRKIARRRIALRKIARRRIARRKKVFMIYPNSVYGQ